jgi:hypothetical protein
MVRTNFLVGIIEQIFLFVKRGINNIESNAGCLATPSSYGKIFSPGGMAEWFKATDLKSVVAARPPGVRIPLPPP